MACPADQAEIYCSVIERKVLTVNDCHHLDRSRALYPPDAERFHSCCAAFGRRRLARTGFLVADRSATCTLVSRRIRGRSDPEGKRYVPARPTRHFDEIAAERDLARDDEATGELTLVGSGDSEGEKLAATRARLHEPDVDDGRGPQLCPCTTTSCSPASTVAGLRLAVGLFAIFRAWPRLVGGLGRLLSSLLSAGRLSEMT